MDTNNTSQYNEDELHAPQWMNEEFFEKVLMQYNDCNNVQVEKLEITPGTGKGDHYASVMFRAKVNYVINGSSESTQQSISMLVKTEAEIGSTKSDMMAEIPLFQTEMVMYSQILPIMTQLLKEAGDETLLNAKLIYCERYPRKILIFEDLVESGYSVLPKRLCNFEESTTVLRILARIHAISYKLYQENNTIIPRMKSAMSKETMERFDFMREGVMYCKEIAANDDNLKQYVPKFDKIEKGLLDEIESLFKETDDHKRGNIMVLNHGDFHSKNIMVKYKDNILQNLVLLDYQACFYGSAVLDLMYAFVMMYGPDVRLNHHEELFSEYIKAFQETLEKLNFKGNIPTKTDFEEEWKKYKRYELFILMNFLCFTYVLTIGEFSVADMLEKPEVRKQVWQGESFLNEIRQQIPRLVKGNYFD